MNSCTLVSNSVTVSHITVELTGFLMHYSGYRAQVLRFTNPVAEVELTVINPDLKPNVGLTNCMTLGCMTREP